MTSGGCSPGAETDDHQAPHEEWLDAASEISTAILEGVALTKVLQLVADVARRLVNGHTALIATPAIDSPSLVIRAASGGRAKALRGMLLPLDGSLAGESMRTGKRLIVADATVDSRAFQEPVRATKVGPILVTPLSARAHTFGVLGVSRCIGQPPFGTRDLDRVVAFAGQAAIALEYSHAQRELRRLAVIDDRERIGRELHDGAIQSLFAVGLELQATRSRAPDPLVKHQLTEAVTRIDDVIRDLRGYISELRPEIREEPSLEQGLERLAVEFEERSSVLTVSEIDARVARELDAVASDVIMMAREALARVGRHSGATTCRLRLRRADNEAIFDVSDDGGGLGRDRSGGNAPDAPMLHERAASIGATWIVGGRGRSGDIEIRIPLPPTARAP